MASSTWKIDTVHSEIGFTVKHMMISKAKGTFDSFNALIQANPEDLTDSKVEVTIEADSINTRNEDRDQHLRSEDFLYVEKHPTITFVATEIKKHSEHYYQITGDLTIRETTRPITVDVNYEGQSKDPMSGDTVAGFSGESQINRKDFGLTWNTTLETGGVLVGEDVKISFEIEAHKQD
ncbi:YceI family protein [Virgibacillus sp. SK37]|uniref:YceI family protein n=1 Tax=Virgibacillus sp. SK37 TaxID=403957 RepID=UPI0004D1A974|nr:YceI family protein [Virgibacillus sp. SK37]AIF43950.1 hypothetical protein X953_12965 [Virgibacillus sp. SK37]